MKPGLRIFRGDGGNLSAADYGNHRVLPFNNVAARNQAFGFAGFGDQRVANAAKSCEGFLRLAREVRFGG